MSVPWTVPWTVEPSCINKPLKGGNSFDSTFIGVTAPWSPCCDRFWTSTSLVKPLRSKAQEFSSSSSNMWKSFGSPSSVSSRRFLSRTICLIGHQGVVTYASSVQVIAYKQLRLFRSLNYFPLVHLWLWIIRRRTALYVELLLPVQLLLPNCVRFGCCYPMACVRFNCCSHASACSPSWIPAQPGPNVLEHCSRSSVQ